MSINESYLAPYASLEKLSKGRLHNEPDCKYRSVYGRDRDRVIHCDSFRRLQYKTQVFVNNTGDHFRTRLTHSLEVAQIARWIATGLGCNKDLAEVVSLSHDLGHAPFGHAGEDILDEKMKEFGGFSHNAHALKIITKLEKRYIDFDGLNLSWEMIEGVVKHNGPLLDDDKIEEYILEYNQKYDLDLRRFSSIESQISAISDDIAYNNHDIEDGIRANLFEPEDLLDLPLIGKRFKDILDVHPNISTDLLVSEAKKSIINDMVVDAVENVKKIIKDDRVKTTEDVRNLGKTLVVFSDEVEVAHQEIKKFLMKNMYRSEKVNRMSANATKVVGGLFDFFMESSDCLPQSSKREVKNVQNKKELAIIVSDHIAGMTDRFAVKEFEELV